LARLVKPQGAFYKNKDCNPAMHSEMSQTPDTGKPDTGKPAPDAPGLIDVESELVGGEPPAAAVGGTGADGAGSVKGSSAFPARRVTPMLLAAFLVIIVVAAGVFFAKKQLRKEDASEAADIAAEPAAETPPAPIVIEPLAAEAGTPLAGDGPAPDKIFNTANDTLKAGADAVIRSTSSEPGIISELPPPPAATSGNDALQDAAKDAAKLLTPKAPAEIDLSSPDAEAALERLQNDPAPPIAVSAAPLLSDLARLTESLEAKTRQAEAQAAEIARLSNDVARLQATGGPLAEQARSALLFDALAQKARSGAPYREELDALKARINATPPIPALESAADAGLATLPPLKSAFSEARNAALAAARQGAAKGPMSRLGANLAGLINLRPAAPLDGDGAVAILSRAEARLDADDLPGALDELSSLAGAPRDAIAGWMEKAARRREADAEIAAVNGVLLAALQSRGAY
jgi:hypothetical protein